MYRWLLSLPLLLLPVLATAATIEVSPGGSIGAATSHMAPGDTVVVHGGSYSSGFAAQTSGTAGAPITIRAVPGETPVITASGGDAINLTDVSWIIVDGLTINGSGNGILIQGAGAGNNQILNCEVASSDGVGIAIQNGAHDNLIKNCRIHDNVQNNFNARGKAASWSAGLTVRHQAPNNTIEDSYIYWNHGEGTSAFDASDGTTWRRNVIADNWSENLYVDGSKNCVIEGNLIYVTNEAKNWNANHNNNSEGIGVSVETYASPPSTRDSIGLHISNNIVVNTARGLGSFVEEGGHTFSGWLVTNNTFVHNDEGIHLTGSTANNIFQDNIVVGGSPVNVPDGTGVFANNVYTDPPLQNASAIPPRFWSNPSLPAPAAIVPLNALAQPYQLQAGSPAKTASSTGGEVGAFGGPGGIGTVAANTGTSSVGQLTSTPPGGAPTTGTSAAPALPLPAPRWLQVRSPLTPHL